MAVDKLVDSTQLDADLTSVADAIRAKGGTSGQLSFPAGFVNAVDAITTGVNIEDTFDDWQRPSDWPDLDAICPDGFEGALITYQVRDTVYYPYNKIHFHINGDAPRTVELGTVQGGVFVPFETHTNVGNIFEEDLPTDHGDFVVARVTCSTFRVAYTTSIYLEYSRLQPSVEMYICGCEFSLLSNVRLTSYNTQHCVFKSCKINSLYGAFDAAYSLKKAEFISCDTSSTSDIRSIFSNCNSLQNVDFSLDLSHLNTIALPLAPYARKLIMHNIKLPDNTSWSLYNQISARPSTQVITLPAFKATHLGNAFNNDYSLMYLDLSRVDLTDVTVFTNAFNGCQALITILLQSVNASISFSASPLLSDESLVGIANALSASVTGQTVTLHEDSKAKCLTIMGNNVDGVFVADATGNMSVTDFITNVKGWTVA